MSSNSNYVFDTESAAEMARLIDQDRLTTRAIGGMFTGISPEEQERLHTVLDIACGPGGWVLDVAFARPDLEVAGVDISSIMIGYASARARSQQLTNASFEIMDITQPLAFSDATFDLVNARLLFGVLRREQCQPFLAECTRLVCPGGWLRLAEPIDLGITNSPAQRAYIRLFVKALWRAGYGLAPDEESLDSTFALPYLLRKLGYESIQYLPSVVDFSFVSPDWSESYHNNRLAYESAKPLLVKLGLISQEEVDTLYEQMLVEMMREDYCGFGHLATISARKPQ